MKPVMSQAEMLARIKQVYAQNGGWPVRVRDVLFQNESPSTAFKYLRRLEAAGLIEKSPHPSGGWRPT